MVASFGKLIQEKRIGKGFFEALSELASGIRESNTSAINQGIDDLDQASFNIAVATAQVGSEMASVETQREVNEETVFNCEQYFPILRISTIVRLLHKCKRICSHCKPRKVAFHRFRI